MDAYGAVAGQLPNVAAVEIGQVDFLLPAAGGDKGDLRPGDALLAGQRFDYVIGKLVRVLARAAVIGFREHDPATPIDHLALQAAAGRAFRGVAAVGAAQDEIAGKREVVLQDFGRGRAITAPERGNDEVNPVALAHRDRGHVLGCERRCR